MEVGYHFDEVNHHHSLDGKPLHGVTSVLRYWGDASGLVNWSASCATDYASGLINSGVPYAEDALAEIFACARVAHTKKRDKAGEVGTSVHAELEYALNDIINNTVDPARPVRPVVQKVLNWFADNGITPLKSEMKVYSREYWFGGIADGVIEKDGVKYILDFKTSGSIQTKAFYQCGAYSVAIKEMKPDAKVGGAVIVHIPRGTSFDPNKNVYWFYQIDALERGFLSILDTYKTDQNLQKLVDTRYINKNIIKI